jgi:superkiller protein 3
MRYTILLAAVSSVMLVVLGCANRDSGRHGGAIDSYVQGVLAYEKGDTTKAMSNLQEAVKKDGDLIMARSLLGDIHRSKAEYDSAREQYEQLATLDPYEYRNHFRLGLVYQLLDRLPDAAVSYLKALDIKPSDSQSNMYLGTIYLTLADREPASRNPEDAAKLRLKAVDFAQKAIEYDPQSAAAHTNLGVALDAVKEYAKAEQAYRKSLDLDSSQTPVRLYLGENLLLQKKFGEARSVLSELTRVEDSPLHRKRLGDAYYGEQNFSEAINQYRTALKLNPDYYHALNAIGAVHIADYRKGLGLDDSKRKAALESWQQSLQIYRSQPQIQGLINQYATAPLFDK